MQGRAEQGRAGQCGKVQGGAAQGRCGAVLAWLCRAPRKSREGTREGQGRAREGQYGKGQGGHGCAGHQGNRKGHCKVKQGKFMPMKKVLLLLQ